MDYELTINGVRHRVDEAPGTPVLWVLRDTLGLTGTKFGCGIGTCGACTVLVDGQAMRSCSWLIEDADSKALTTIEGLSDDVSHPLQMAWLQAQVPQCGYCQGGQILAAAALLAETPRPIDQDIDMAMTNICRCGTYPRIRHAIKLASGQAG